MLATAFLKGMGLGGSLIVPSVRKTPICCGRRSSVNLLQLRAICVLCDVVLIGAGVAGMGALISEAPALLMLIKIAGVAFLGWYGWRAARSALQPGSMQAGAETAAADRRTVLTAMLAFSLLNPHVYLDTVVLLGSIGGQQAGMGRWYFAAGAMLASLLWFSSLGLAARYLTPVFARPRAWQVLDVVIALVM
jgi:L-lysine exporter family protein LysE/ArgO